MAIEKIMDQQNKARKIIENLEEYKKTLRQRQPKEDESLSEWQLCRKYSKTRSMGQD
jgi:hypothetical protein|tara:strand:+ start:377 stop:547 length:171 start_codon:yes stop_codon:yes gene_type:complete